MISTVALTAALLAALQLPSAAPATAPDAAPVGAPGVKVWVSGDQTAAISGGRALVSFEVDADAYVTVLALDAAGAARVIFPRSPRDTAIVRAGKTYRVPAYFGFVSLSLSHHDVEYALAVASTRRFDYSNYRFSAASWRPQPVNYRRTWDPVAAIEDFVDNALPDVQSDYSFDYATYHVYARPMYAYGRYSTYGGLYNCLAGGMSGYNPFWFSMWASMNPWALSSMYQDGLYAIRYAQSSGLGAGCSPSRNYRRPIYVALPQVPKQPGDTAKNPLPTGVAAIPRPTDDRPLPTQPGRLPVSPEAGEPGEASGDVHETRRGAGAWTNPRVPRSTDFGARRVTSEVEASDREPARRPERGAAEGARRIPVASGAGESGGQELLGGRANGPGTRGGRGRPQPGDDAGDRQVAERMRAEPQPDRDRGTSSGNGSSGGYSSPRRDGSERDRPSRSGGEGSFRAPSSGSSSGSGSARSTGSGEASSTRSSGESARPAPSSSGGASRPVLDPGAGSSTRPPL